MHHTGMTLKSPSNFFGLDLKLTILKKLSWEMTTLSLEAYVHFIFRREKTVPAKF